MSDPQPDPGSALPTRATLLFRVRTWNDRASWEEFHGLYRPLVYGRARRSGLAHADAEDVAQDVFKCVAESIGDFEYDPAHGTFRGWLMQLTHWRVMDKFASRAKAEGGAASGAGAFDRTAALERVPAPDAEDADWDTEWQQRLLEAAVARLARNVKPRHFQVFELYVRQQRPVLKVSLELGINPASVYVIGHRLTKQLKTEVEKLRAQFG